jgi:hypothetical protein
MHLHIMGESALIMNGIKKWTLLIYSKLHNKILKVVYVGECCNYQLAKFSLGLGLCVLATIFKLVNFALGHMSLDFYYHFEAHGDV